MQSRKRDNGSAQATFPGKRRRGDVHGEQKKQQISQAHHSFPATIRRGLEKTSSVPMAPSPLDVVVALSG